MNKKIAHILIGIVVIFGVGLFVYAQNTADKSKAIKSNIGNNKIFSLEQVLEHNNRESCWSLVNGAVYDLTSWIPNHPGGEKSILSICGKDGSNKFNRKHGNSEGVLAVLSGFKIGNLAQ